MIAKSWIQREWKLFTTSWPSVSILQNKLGPTSLLQSLFMTREHQTDQDNWEVFVKYLLGTRESHWYWMPMEQVLWSGTSMHHLQYTLVWKVILVDQYIRSRLSYCHIDKAEVEQKKFDWKWISWSKWSDAIHPLDLSFPRSWGVQDFHEHLLPQQHDFPWANACGTLHIEKKLSVVWCPTAEMIAGFITEPLQGTTSRKFRDIIMGIETNISGNNICNKRKLKKTDENKKSKESRSNSLAHYYNTRYRDVLGDVGEAYIFFFRQSQT